MVRRALRSKTLRKISVKTPGSKVVHHYRKKSPKKAHCAKCGAVLHGVASKRPIEMNYFASWSLNTNFP
jgi:large subunit ribosomal protein L34e